MAPPHDEKRAIALAMGTGPCRAWWPPRGVNMDVLHHNGEAQDMLNDIEALIAVNPQ